ncbi:MAG: hypothetical protein ACOZCO_05205 [Bacteroidota bacterium]
MERRTEVFKDNTLEKIKRILEVWDEKGTPRFYSVQVDGEPIVSRTNNPGEFDNVKAFIFHNTEQIRVAYYRGNETEPSEEAIYTIAREKEKSNGLSGVEIDERIAQALDAERRKWEHEQLKKELSDTKKELNEAEDHIDNLESLVEELKSSKNKLGNVHVGEVVSVMVESFLKRNVDKIKRLPGGSTLAGILADGGEGENKEPQKETEATYEKVEDEEDTWWSDVQKAFNEKELEYIQAIVTILAHEKNKIQDVFSIIQPGQK